MKPAMTKDEWEAKPDPSVVDGGWEFKRWDEVRPELFIGYRGNGPAVTLSAVSRPHALAALALHGQPFGFTREDVTNLREVQSWCSSQGDIDSPYMETWARTLADRIEALLPPEG